MESNCLVGGSPRAVFAREISSRAMRGDQLTQSWRQLIVMWPRFHGFPTVSIRGIRYGQVKDFEAVYAGVNWGSCRPTSEPAMGISMVYWGKNGVRF